MHALTHTHTHIHTHTHTHTHTHLEVLSRAGAPLAAGVHEGVSDRRSFTCTRMDPWSPVRETWLLLLLLVAGIHTSTAGRRIQSVHSESTSSDINDVELLLSVKLSPSMVSLLLSFCLLLGSPPALRSSQAHGSQVEKSHVTIINSILINYSKHILTVGSFVCLPKFSLLV